MTLLVAVDEAPIQRAERERIRGVLRIAMDRYALDPASLAEWLRGAVEMHEGDNA